MVIYCKMYLERENCQELPSQEYVSEGLGVVENVLDMYTYTVFLLTC